MYNLFHLAVVASTQELLSTNSCMLLVCAFYFSLRFSIGINIRVSFCNITQNLNIYHSTGFWHEQSRADRDSHVRINTRNIIPGMEYNFLKYSLNKINHLKAKYDTCSVMHYGAYAFSKNRRPTIARIGGSESCELGQRCV